MRAVVFDGSALAPADVAEPDPGHGEILIEVSACGVCRTDLHIVDGELTEPKLPLIIGHQIVGRVLSQGSRFRPGDRVGVPWLGWTDGTCRYCTSDRENLCDQAQFTGYDRDGGYAELAAADERFCLPLPDEADFPDLAAAPLLCAGLIGFRTLRLAGDPERLGIYGFGSAAHIVTQVARHEGRRIFAFVRAGDERAGELVPAALRATAKGGTVVCGGIHMTDIPSFPYDLLWGERVVRSVANLTRQDGEEFLQLAPQVPVRTEVETFPLESANEALDRLRAGEVRGAAVLVV